MRVLILGGTRFAGRALVEAALGRGHEVTVFNRGTAAPPPGARELRGDRDRREAPRGRWDIAFDTAIEPRWVEDAVASVEADLWAFVSTISVYADFSRTPVTETAPLRDPGGDRYDDRKVACERALPPGSLIARAGLIVGPHDPTGRLAHWVARIGAGGEVLIPAVGEQPVQMIDVRDLAEWMVAMAERRQAGTYNATGPGMSFREVIAAIPGGGELIWTDPRWLEEQGVEPWTDLPLWTGTNPADAGFMRIDASRALANGLALRPLCETIAATAGQAGTGIARDRERALIARWRAHSRGGR